MTERKYFAHKGHLLSKHLKDVGTRASDFAGAFDASLHGEIAGLWHDLGKFHFCLYKLTGLLKIKKLQRSLTGRFKKQTI